MTSQLSDWVTLRRDLKASLALCKDDTERSMVNELIRLVSQRIALAAVLSGKIRLPGRRGRLVLIEEDDDAA